MEWLDPTARRLVLRRRAGESSLKVPWEVGRVLTPDEWESYCKQVMSDCRHCGIPPGAFRSGAPDFALLLKPGEWPRLAKLVQKLTGEMLAAEEELLLRPDLYRLLGLPARIRRVMEECGLRCQPKSAARLVRFDFHFTKEGWLLSEANSDRPGGLEDYGFTKAMTSYYPGFSPPPNPASKYAEAIHGAVGRNGLIGIVHASPRRYIRDAQLLAREVERRGMRTMLLLPRRLSWISNLARIRASSRMCTPDLLIRRVRWDWLPRPSQHAVWEPWFCGGKTLMSNPGTAVLIQSKRFLVIWKELDTPMSAWRSFLPETRCPGELPGGSVTDWVFKPAFGGDGAGVAIAGVTKSRAFREIAEKARHDPTRWVAQRRFESVALPTERGPSHVCLGIYTVNGVAAGAFTRIRGKALIDKHSLWIPVLIPDTDA
jgi:hypothetical protein